jgi:hypothetical protein
MNIQSLIEIKKHFIDTGIIIEIKRFIVCAEQLNMDEQSELYCNPYNLTDMMLYSSFHLNGYYIK